MKDSADILLRALLDEVDIVEWETPSGEPCTSRINEMHRLFIMEQTKTKPEDIEKLETASSKLRRGRARSALKRFEAARKAEFAPDVKKHWIFMTLGKVFRP